MVPTLASISKLAGHSVKVCDDHTKRSMRSPLHSSPVSAHASLLLTYHLVPDIA